MAKEPRLQKSQITAAIKSPKPYVQQFRIGTVTMEATPKMDLLYKTVEKRIEAEPSVITWSYVSEKGLTTIEVEFVDESSILRVVVDPYNFADLQAALQTIDSYFIAKSTRS